MHGYQHILNLKLIGLVIAEILEVEECNFLSFIIVERSGKLLGSITIDHLKTVKV